jgi:hypothetical protein
MGQGRFAGAAVPHHPTGKLLGRFEVVVACLFALAADNSVIVSLAVLPQLGEVGLYLVCRYVRPEPEAASLKQLTDPARRQIGVLESVPFGCAGWAG